MGTVGETNGVYAVLFRLAMLLFPFMALAVAWSAKTLVQHEVRLTRLESQGDHARMEDAISALNDRVNQLPPRELLERLTRLEMKVDTIQLTLERSD